jgi:hypothetical protein
MAGFEIVTVLFSATNVQHVKAIVAAKNKQNAE